MCRVEGEGLRRIVITDNKVRELRFRTDTARLSFNSCLGKENLIVSRSCPSYSYDSVS